MAKKLGIIIVVVLLVIIAVAFLYFQISKMGDGASKTDGNGNNIVSGSGSKIVEIKGFSFNPKEIRIKAGESVTWTNGDSVKHTVTSDSGSELDSALLSEGETYSHTFNEAGTFDYHCTPHPSMKAKIIVE